jgi:hypothetical protein
MARSTLHLDVVTTVAVADTIALLAILLVLLAATLGRCSSRVFGAGFGGLLLGCDPARNLPGDTSEALELKSSLCPSATRFARAVESAQAGVDSPLVCLGSKFVTCGRFGARVIDRAVLPGSGS